MPEIRKYIGANKEEISRLRVRFLKQLKVINEIKNRIRNDTSGLSNWDISKKYASDTYCIHLIKKSYGIETVPKEMIVLKRKQLLFSRELKKMREV